MTFQQILSEHFPNTMPEADFVRHTYHLLLKYGFDKGNTLVCVGLCHDEVTHSLRKEIRKMWGDVFNLASVAGLFFVSQRRCSTINQAIALPEEGTRYILYTMPHITIGVNGEISLCQRPSLAGASSACGALVAFRRELASGYLSIELDPHDRKKSRLKQSLSEKVKSGQVPCLVSLTKLTHKIILEDLKQMIELVASTTDPPHQAFQRQYAILGGIQIHGPDQRNYIWPGEFIMPPLNGNGHRACQ